MKSTQTNSRKANSLAEKSLFRLLVCLLFFVGCNGSSDSSPDSSHNIIVDWNEAMLAAVRASPARPTVIARSLYLVHTAMYDTWTMYTPHAKPHTSKDNLRRPETEHTEEMKARALSQAAYTILINEFPVYSQEHKTFEQLLSSVGSAPYRGETPDSPEAIGFTVAQALLEQRRHDGSNGLENFKDPSQYSPANLPSVAPIDPNRWQPLRVPTGEVKDSSGYPIADSSRTDSYVDQQFLTPHWGNVKGCALSSGNSYRPPAPPRVGSQVPYTDALGQTLLSHDAFVQQFTAVLHESQTLDDEKKVITEYWADGPRSNTPPGHWNELAHGISERDNHSLDEDVQLYFILNCALFDASIAAWDAKRAYDSPRPITAIRHLYAGREIKGWGGKGRGTVSMLGEYWQPYQSPTFITPAFPEFVSGHSTFSAAAAEILSSFTGSNQFFDGSSRGQDFDNDGEPDMVGQFVAAPGFLKLDEGPANPVVLRWNSFQEASDQAGMSRIYGGIHAQDGDLHGRILGQRVAENAFAYFEKLQE